MKFFYAVLALFLVFLVTPAHAELYKFIDSDGKVHFVDDVHKIPDEYRKGAEIVETRPLNIVPAAVDEEPATDTAASVDKTKQEIFGEHPLFWWEKQINSLRIGVADAKEIYDAKKDYVSVFESGRRVGRIFKENEIEKYEKFKKELPVAEERLKAKEEALSNLLRKARRAGVPRTVRGD